MPKRVLGVETIGEGWFCTHAKLQLLSLEELKNSRKKINKTAEASEEYRLGHLSTKES